MFKDGLRISGGLLATFVVILVLGTGGGIFAAYYDNWFSSATAEPRGQREMRENTKANGAFRQEAYERFFDLCTSAQTSQQQMDALNTELKTADSDRAAQIRTSLTALTGGLNEAVNKYNAEANEFHRSQFLDNKLPYPLNAKDEIQCV
jgi:hypothetical protein